MSCAVKNCGVFYLYVFMSVVNRILQQVIPATKSIRSSSPITKNISSLAIGSNQKISSNLTFKIPSLSSDSNSKKQIIQVIQIIIFLILQILMQAL